MVLGRSVQGLFYDPFFVPGGFFSLDDNSGTYLT